MIKQLNSVIMFSKDLDAAKKWYQDTLGFEVLYHAPKKFLSLRHNEMGRIDFHPTTDGSSIGKGAMANYAVADIAKVKAWLQAKGVRVSDIQQGGDSPRHGWFWDHEGNVLGLEED